MLYWPLEAKGLTEKAGCYDYREIRCSQKKLTEALLRDEVTPSAATRISGMLEELAHESMNEERLDVLDRELDDIMGNLTGSTVDEIKDKLVKGEVGFIEMVKMWFRSR